MKPLAPWDRQPGEPTPAFHAFTLYRDLGYRRSLSRVATDLIEQGHRRGTAKTTTVRRNLATWSGQFKWVERVAAWDSELDRQRQLEDRRQRRAMRDRQASLAEAFQQTLSVPVRAMLDKLQANPNLVQELSEADTTVILSLAAQAARALPAVVAVEREARGPDVDVSEGPRDVPAGDRPREEDRLRRVAAIMGSYGLLPPGDDGDGPGPILMPPRREGGA